MTPEERRAAVVAVISSDPSIWWRVSTVQYWAFLAEQPNGQIADFYVWENERGNSLSAFRGTCTELYAECVLERCNTLSGMFARHEYSLPVPGRPRLHQPPLFDIA